MYRKTVSLFIALLCIATPCLPALAETVEMAVPTEIVAPAETPAPSATPEVYREMLNGSADKEGESHVRRLQERLIEIGYMSAAASADGHYGDQTEEALRVFQELNGLPATGVADIDTQVLLFTSNQFAPAPTPAPTPRVRGTSGDDIRDAQEKLAMWGFLNGTPDGSYGRATERAVKAYKNYIHNLAEAQQSSEPELTFAPEPVDTPDIATIAEQAFSFGTPPPTRQPGEEITPEPTATPEPFVATGEIDDEMLLTLRNDDFVVFREELRNGSSGPEVVRLQTRLGQLGYLYIGENGVDGAFGNLTEGALRYFQRRNQLDQTGIASETVQRVLYSANAERSDERVFPYKLFVDVSDQRVYVYRWTGEGYTEKVKTMVCSTGTKKTPTILGTYSCSGRAGDWYFFKEFNCWARYAFRIEGGYLFHSVTFSSKGSKYPHSGAVSNLGRRASHGCVRLSVEDAKWLYENCPNGITVVIRE